MIKKDYRINFEGNFCRVTFNRPDGVSLKEIIQALVKTDQTKLYKAFAGNNVMIFVAKGYMLGQINQATYEKGKRTLESILKKGGRQ